MVTSVYRNTWTGRAGYEGPESTDPSAGSLELLENFQDGDQRRPQGRRELQAAQGSVGVRRRSVQDIRV